MSIFTTKLLASVDVSNYQLLEPLLSGGGTTHATTFTAYIQTIFKTTITIGAVFAVLMLVVGGVEKIISKTPAGQGDGNQRMKSSLIGLMLLLVSATLLATINPNLLNLDFFNPGGPVAPPRPPPPTVCSDGTRPPCPRDNNPPDVPPGGATSFEVGQEYPTRATAYYPSNSALEGGFNDRRGAPLYTLQQYLAGEAPYVSVAMDRRLNVPYGQRVRIPELEQSYNNGNPIEFRVVDTGSAFTDRGTSRIDICTANEAASLDERINRNLTLIPYN